LKRLGNPCHRRCLIFEAAQREAASAVVVRLMLLDRVRRTPVYMSPELINSRNGAKGYDGKSVDVWASGVLLIVMMLGTFPFDHTENPDPNTSEAHLEVW
jgi:serine/threonine protein kinase